MPKYWVKNYFAHGSFPEVGQNQKTEKKKGERGEKEERKRRERLTDGDNNGQATHGARKHAWRTQAAWANKKLISLIIHTWTMTKPALKFGSLFLSSCTCFFSPSLTSADKSFPESTTPTILPTWQFTEVCSALYLSLTNWPNLQTCCVHLHSHKIANWLFRPVRLSCLYSCTVCTQATGLTSFVCLCNWWWRSMQLARLSPTNAWIYFPIARIIF